MKTSMDQSEDAPTKGSEEGVPNRRAHERFPVPFVLQVRDGERVLGMIDDISEGGMRIKLDDGIGENENVREWTGHKGISNREYVLNNLVGETFDLKIVYMGISIGQFKAKLVRVIRIMTKLYFAMQFIDVQVSSIHKIMNIVKKRTS